MIYVHKILPLLISPLFIFLTAALIFTIKKRNWTALSITIIFSISCTSITANPLWRILEAGQTPIHVKNASKTDAIVVLSGMIGAIEFDGNQFIQWGNADRFMKGIELIEHGKGDLIIFTGGNLPWQQLTTDEGSILKEKALEMNISKEQILVTSQVENTAQEAQEVAKLLASKTKKITLVTSAFHMPRASNLFKQQGFDVYQFPVDFRSRAQSQSLTPMDYIPSAAAANKTFEAIREFLGRTYYGIRSWIKI
jgi:uncharacterized SAM-binding protein YcdF (DUF218 family)